MNSLDKIKKTLLNMENGSVHRIKECENRFIIYYSDIVRQCDVMLLITIEHDGVRWYGVSPKFNFTIDSMERSDVRNALEFKNELEAKYFQKIVYEDEKTFEDSLERMSLYLSNNMHINVRRFKREINN